MEIDFEVGGALGGVRRVLSLEWDVDPPFSCHYQAVDLKDFPEPRHLAFDYSTE